MTLCEIRIDWSYFMLWSLASGVRPTLLDMASDESLKISSKSSLLIELRFDVLNVELDLPHRHEQLTQRRSCSIIGIHWNESHWSVLKTPNSIAFKKFSIFFFSDIYFHSPSSANSNHQIRFTRGHQKWVSKKVKLRNRNNFIYFSFAFHVVWKVFKLFMVRKNTLNHSHYSFRFHIYLHVPLLNKHWLQRVLSRSKNLLFIDWTCYTFSLHYFWLMFRYQNFFSSTLLDHSVLVYSSMNFTSSQQTNVSVKLETMIKLSFSSLVQEKFLFKLIFLSLSKLLVFLLLWNIT